MSELELQVKIYNLFRDNGYDVYTEVPFLTRSIDIVAVRNGRVCTYELKLHDWRKAIKQSIDHLHGADESYICLPKMTKISDEMLELAQANGIGVVLFDIESNSLEEVLPPQESEFEWPPAKSWLTSALGAGAAI